MARNEQDREDLMREATALSPRLELISDEFPGEPIVIGFRRDGSSSIYFGADPVFHFNSNGEWRRGFQQGRLLKAERGQPVELERVRGAGEVSLVRRPLSPSETAEYITQMLSRLNRLWDALEAGNVRVTEQVPPENDLLVRVRTWLQDRLLRVVIADRPHAGS